jgi:hypothetical protein
VVGPIWASEAWSTSSPAACIPEKIDPKKRLDPFDVRKVPETQKYTKKGFLLHRIKYQINGDFVENLQN